MKTSFFSMILVLASLAVLTTGCPSDPIHNTNTGDTAINQDSFTNPDSSSTDTGSDTAINTDGVTGWDEIKVGPDEGLAAIYLNTPDKKPATFHVCVNIVCDPVNWTSPVVQNFENVTNAFPKFAAHTKLKTSVTVHVERPNYLFADWQTEVTGAETKGFVSTYEYAWADKGTWGAQLPDGNYQSSLNPSIKKKVAESVKNGKVTLILDGLNIIVTDHELSPDPTNPGIQITGKINDDLHSFHIQVSFPSSPSDDYEETLTLVQ